MRHIIAAAAFGAVALLPFVSQDAKAASEDECAIWLCAPAGFGPSECSPARSAMISRVRDFKPPLPPLSACMANPPSGAAGGSSSDMSGNHGVAAYIPERRVCRNWGYRYRQSTCTRWGTLPERYVRGQRCRRANNDAGGMIPEGCTRTARYVEVFVDGELAGNTYYW